MWFTGFLLYKAIVRKRIYKLRPKNSQYAATLLKATIVPAYFSNVLKKKNNGWQQNQRGDMTITLQEHHSTLYQLQVQSLPASNNTEAELEAVIYTKASHRDKNT
jgi:hypothetical protein